MNQLKQSEISDCFFIGKNRRNITRREKDSMEYLFKKQSRGIKERIRREENSVHNSHNICCMDFEFYAETRVDGLLHGRRM